jgi:hypothetical protein
MPGNDERKKCVRHRCLQALNSIMKARYMSKKVKIRIHKTVINPIVVKPGLYRTSYHSLSDLEKGNTQYNL